MQILVRLSVTCMALTKKDYKEAPAGKHMKDFSVKKK